MNAERQKCPRCGMLVPIVFDSNNRRVLKAHARVTLGSKRPAKLCKSSGLKALPVDPFEGFRQS